MFKKNTNYLKHIIIILVVIAIIFAIIGIFGAKEAISDPIAKLIDEELIVNGFVSYFQDKVTKPQIYDDSPVLGDADAPVTIFEFSCFACPYSAEVQQILKQVMNKYHEQVKIVWKDLPMVEVYDDALLAHQAARCAGQQGKFWQYHDLLWQNQADFSIGNLSNLARVAGLNLADFETCLNGDEALFALKKDTDEANDLLISGTPHFYINSQELLGAVKFEDFTRIINVELNKK